jgi:hypothetical protein
MERRCPEVRRARGQGLGNHRRRLYRRVGDGEYARSPLGRDEAKGDLFDQRHAHDRAFLRGFDFDPKDAQTREPAEVGYEKGVPMGGDLRGAPQGKAPTFLVGALRDPIGANLDGIQIIKGWVDRAGQTHEKIFDVVWGNADRRRPDADSKLPPVGSTVDVANATWTNTIGDPELITVWRDPEFDPSLRAFYYARVLEIPTPRWTAYDAKRFNVQMAPNVPMITQERAFTSPIWYTP